MKNIVSIRKIITAIIAIYILAWATLKNRLFIKIVISPFLICAIAVLIENIFILLNKEKIANIFKTIYRISFFVYFFGFLAYAKYYSIANKSYSLFIPILIFLFFGINFFKGAFFRKDNDNKKKGVKNYGKTNSR